MQDRQTSAACLGRALHSTSVHDYTIRPSGDPHCSHNLLLAILFSLVQMLMQVWSLQAIWVQTIMSTYFHCIYYLHRELY